jgi:hypothetical protein
MWALILVLILSFQGDDLDDLEPAKPTSLGHLTTARASTITASSILATLFIVFCMWLA